MEQKNTGYQNLQELKPRIIVIGVGGAGGNAINNMIRSNLEGVEFLAANTDAQALTMSKADHVIQMGMQLTEGLGAGSKPEIGAAAAEEAIEEIRAALSGAHMVFITAGMGGGTGTGAAPVIGRIAREMDILTVGVVTRPFDFEGQHRARSAQTGIDQLTQHVDTLIVIPNQNLFLLANEQTTFTEAFEMADEVLHAGVGCITDLMVKEGLINLDFADVRVVMGNMGKALMGTGVASGDERGRMAAEAAITNRLLDDITLGGAKGVLVSIMGGKDLTLYEVQRAADRIREEVAKDANIIVGAYFDETLSGEIRVSVLATGIENLHDESERMIGRTENMPDFLANQQANPGSASTTEASEYVPAEVREKTTAERDINTRDRSLDHLLSTAHEIQEGAPQPGFEKAGNERLPSLDMPLNQENEVPAMLAGNRDRAHTAAYRETGKPFHQQPKSNSWREPAFEEADQTGFPESDISASRNHVLRQTGRQGEGNFVRPRSADGFHASPPVRESQSLARPMPDKKDFSPFAQQMIDPAKSESEQKGNVGSLIDKVSRLGIFGKKDSLPEASEDDYSGTQGYTPGRSGHLEFKDLTNATGTDEAQEGSVAEIPAFFRRNKEGS